MPSTGPRPRRAAAFDRARRVFSARLLGSRRRLLGLVVVAGLAGGSVGAGFLAAMHGLERLLWPTHWSSGPHLVVLVAVGVTVAVLVRVVGSPGDVELLVDNIHVRGGPDDIRELRSLIPVSLLCIASGGGLGPEAPLVQTTGSLGSWLASKWGLSREETRVLAITGMASGFTVLFGAPLGAAVFALEILHRRGLEYYEALMPAVIGSLIGFAAYTGLTGHGLTPVWHFPDAAPLRTADFGWAVLCGAVGAAVGGVFTELAVNSRSVIARLPVGIRPVVGGLGLGLLALWSPYALTFGEDQLNAVARHPAVLSFLLVAAAAKLLGSSLTLASGWKGGFIIPLFFVGATLGRAGHLLLPGTGEVVLMAAMMAACNVAVTKTPIGSTLVVTEMAGLQLLPTTLVAAVVALFLSSQVGLIQTQRDRGPGGDPTS